MRDSSYIGPKRESRRMPQGPDAALRHPKDPVDGAEILADARWNRCNFVRNFRNIRVREGGVHQILDIRYAEWAPRCVRAAGPQ